MELCEVWGGKVRGCFARSDSESYVVANEAHLGSGMLGYVVGLNEVRNQDVQELAG